MLRIGKRREEYFAVAQAALLEVKHRKSIGNPGEGRNLLRQRGNDRFVGHPEVTIFAGLFFQEFDFGGSGEQAGSGAAFDEFRTAFLPFSP